MLLIYTRINVMQCTCSSRDKNIQLWHLRPPRERENLWDQGSIVKASVSENVTTRWNKSWLVVSELVFKRSVAWHPKLLCSLVELSTFHFLNCWSYKKLRNMSQSERCAIVFDFPLIYSPRRLFADVSWAAAAEDQILQTLIKHGAS